MRKLVDAKMFSCVKALLKSGAPYSEIKEYFEISDSTIGRISSADTFQEYKQGMAEAALRWSKNRVEKEKKKEAKQIEMQLEKQEKPAPQMVEHKQTVVVQATHYMMEEMKKTNELLTLLNAKLAFIVEELTGAGGDKA